MNLCILCKKEGNIKLLKNKQLCHSYYINISTYFSGKHDSIEEKIEHPTTRVVIAFKKILNIIEEVDKKSNNFKTLKKMYEFKKNIPMESFVIIENFKKSDIFKNTSIKYKNKFYISYNVWNQRCITYNSKLY